MFRRFQTRFSFARARRDAYPDAGPGRVAELIFKNGTIYLDEKTTTDALAVGGKKVLASGAAALALAGPGTKEVDLKEAFAFPGFNDSHVHVMASSVANIFLDGCTTPESILDKVVQAVPKLTEGQWIVGGGWDLQDLTAWKLEHLAKLNDVTKGHPCLLVDGSGHSFIVNDDSMRFGNMTVDAKLPPGAVVKKQDGKLTGLMQESAISLIGDRLGQVIPDEQYSLAAQFLLPYYASMGFTSIVDILGLPGVDTTKPQVYIGLEKQGKLPMRIHYLVPIAKMDDVENVIAHRGQSTDMVRYVGAKLWVDGALRTACGWTTFTNKIAEPEYPEGVYYWAPDDRFGEQYNLAKVVKKLDGLGINVHHHVVGDAAADQILGILKDIHEHGGLKARHCLVHVYLVRDDQIALMKELGVVATAQFQLWALTTELMKKAYDVDKIVGVIPWKKIVDAGVPLGYSSDFPSTPAALVHCLQVATDPDKYYPPGRTPVPVAEIIRGYTSGSAACAWAADIGTLKPGMLADITILDKNPFNTAPADMDKIKVLSTWINGVQAYAAK